MPTTLTKEAYKRLLAEDMDWLQSECDRTLERDHIIDILRYEHEHCVMKQRETERIAPLRVNADPTPDPNRIKKSHWILIACFCIVVVLLTGCFVTLVQIKELLTPTGM